MKKCDLSVTIRRARLSAFVVLAIASGCMAQAQPAARVPRLDKVCGRLLSVADANATVEQESHPLRKTSVRLYRQSNGRACCDPSDKIAETETRRDGNFSFDLDKSKRGLYWVAVTFEGRELTQLIRFEPPKGAPELCSRSLFEVDRAGHFTHIAFVTVD